MTHPGPDFLPYPLPAVAPTWQPVTPSPSASPPPTTGRWSKALDGVSTLGIVSIGSGLGALVLLVLVTGVADRPGPGAAVTALAAVVSLVSGWVALRAVTARDSRTLVVAAQSVAALSAVVAAMVYASSGGDEQVVSPPRQSTPAPSTQPSNPGQPSQAPTPSATIPPPGSVNGFGVPSTPGSPLTNDPTTPGTLQGHVVDTAGRPIKGATVTVTRATAGDTSSTPQCPTRVTTLTDADGVYQLQLCQLGDNLGYHVRIQVGTHVAEQDVYVNSGNTTTYDVILPR